MPQRVLYMLEKSGNSKACKKASRLCWPSLNRTNVHFIAFTNRVCSQERGNKRGVQVSLWAAKPIQWPGQAQAVPAWLQARASWCRSYENYGSERSTYGQQSLVWGMTQPYEMFCPSNKLMLTNMPWCVVHFWEGTSCKWLGLGTICRFPCRVANCCRHRNCLRHCGLQFYIFFGEETAEGTPITVCNLQSIVNTLHLC